MEDKNILDWEKLLCDDTLSPREEQPSVWEKYPVGIFEKDYREVISGAIFRNLQNKAQVFSSVDSGIVRTRLTHSLEVSSVAKQLGIMVTNNRRTGGKSVSYGENTERYSESFSMILACAGLLHDLGNPPFGHFGEASIGFWFKKRFADPSFTYKGKPVGELFTDQMKNDLINFDGNAQTIHLLLKNAYTSGINDINVSMAVINTLVKYPGSSLDIDHDHEDIRRHKFGYYYGDEKYFNMIRSATGLYGIIRHPLTYLLEAADDISYLISDLSDALAMNVVTVDNLVEEFTREVESMPREGSEFYELQFMAASSMLEKLNANLQDAHTQNDRLSGVYNWFNNVRDWLIYDAAHSWFENYDAIITGTFTGELMSNTWHAYIIRVIRRIMKLYVYPSKAVIETELMGHGIIKKYLDRFIPTIMYYDAEDADHKLGPVEKRHVWHMPKYILSDYERQKTDDEIFNLYLRFLSVVDSLSSMTDSEAISAGNILI